MHLSSIRLFSSFDVFRPLIAVILYGISLEGASWKKITPEEFALQESSVDAEYGAEILFSEATLEQQLSDNGTIGSWKFYTRIKVFNQNGVEQLTKKELTYRKDYKISSIQGRTVKPDGRVISLEKKDIFDQEVVKKGTTQLRAKRFAFPGLEPGDIVELQYNQNPGQSAWFVEMEFQDWLPAKRVRRRLKPLSEFGIGWRISAFQWDGRPLEQTSKGFFDFEFTNMPAKEDEPFSVPNMHKAPIVLLYYFNLGSEPATKNYWKSIAKELYREGKKKLKPSKDIEAFVKEHTKGLESDEKRLEALYLYCQDEITNHHYSHGIFTSKELEKLPENFSAQHTFSRGHGTPADINQLFGAMAQVLGYEPRFAKAPDNRFLRFDPNRPIPYSLSEESVALNMGGKHRFFNPGNPFLPADSVEWWCYGNEILVGTDKGEFMVDAPMPEASFSKVIRSAEFSVDEEGTLKGRVTQDYTGFKDLDMKEGLSSRLSREELEDYIVQDLKQAQRSIKASNFKILNRGSSVIPLQISYDLEIPEFADVTGKRIFVQPSALEKGMEPLFTEDTRQSDIAFPYPWTELDDFRISLPDGYSLEAGSAPSPLSLDVLGSFKISLGLSKKTGAIVFKRSQEIDLNYVSVRGYEILRDLFVEINQRDQHTLTFKKNDT